MKVTILIFICLLFIILDIPYLILFGERWSNMVEKIQQHPMTINTLSALVVYAILGIGLYGLVLRHPMNMQDTLMYSALFGFSTYGVFNYTNMALFDDYALSTAIIDTTWGGIVSAGVGYIAKSYLM